MRARPAVAYGANPTHPFTRVSMAGSYALCCICEDSNTCDVCNEDVYGVDTYDGCMECNIIVCARCAETRPIGGGLCAQCAYGCDEI